MDFLLKAKAQVPHSIERVKLLSALCFIVCSIDGCSNKEPNEDYDTQQKQFDH